MNAEPMDGAAPVVIVGAGQAGFSTAAKLRDFGHAGPIALIGEEASPPYQRPPLSKAYLLGEMSEDRLLLKPSSFYAQKDIELLLSARVERIDRRSREVVLADGRAFPYARLVLATGARPKTLPAAIGGELDGVYAIRTIRDIAAMSGAFRPGRRALVVGGGYVGLEAAAVASKLGLDVTLIEAGPRILGRVAAAETSTFFRELHRSHGVDLREATTLASLGGAHGRIDHATLGDGARIAVDFAIVGIGVQPNVELAVAAGLETDDGVLVDAHLATSDPLIFAVGDCASFLWRGQRIRLESVGNAIDQGEAAAASILGRSEGFAAKPWFWSDQFDVKLQIAGLSSGYDRVVTRPGAGAARSFWYYRGEELLAVDAVNDGRVYMVAKRLIEAGRSPSPELVVHADDPKALMAGPA
ncbi:FAD-dependent oxidoreductase [Methylopila sp. M107]|uniref:NAD(P)/FAD-dependent oxidoreductase n=1 Tax=Methylopila sp. M107 TaxID=1101190 RepID=UPI000364963D|nr:FAD-dependent oxidoreductase [Methylopila sp. M107]